jgi:hypothetical protein
VDVPRLLIAIARAQCLVSNLNSSRWITTNEGLLFFAIGNVVGAALTLISFR